MSLIFAKILGIYILVVAFGLLLNPDRFRKLGSKAIKDDTFLMLGGIMALLFGATVVSLHNLWVLDWPLFITLLGWWGVIKGAGLLCTSEFAKMFKKMFSASDEAFRILGLIYAAIGAFLVFKGFM